MPTSKFSMQQKVKQNLLFQLFPYEKEILQMNQNENINALRELKLPT